MTLKRVSTVIAIFGFVGSIAFSVPEAQEPSKPPAVPLTGQEEFNDTVLPRGDQGDLLLISDDNEIRIAQMDRPAHGAMEPEAGEHGYRSKLMIMWNLVDYLNLDEEAAADFFPIFNDYSQKREKLTETHRVLVEQIVDNVEKESFSVGELKNLVQKLEEADDSLRKEHAAFLEKAKKILNDRQYIKLVIFNDKLKKDLFNRFSSKRMGMNMPEGSEMRNPDTNRQDLNIQNIDKKRVEELQKMLEQQQKEIERQQRQIEKLLKEK